MAAIHDGKAGHGIAYQALEQTAGRGQRGKAWVTGRNMNIALSAVLEPGNILPVGSFLLGAATAVAVRSWLENYISGSMIKWPNDIYIHDKKIAGILIENIVRGNKWNYAVVGIGVNINQPQFDPELTNATSLNMLTGKTYDIIVLGRALCEHLEEQWQLLQHAPEQVMNNYNGHLFRKNMPVRFKEGNRVFTATVKRVAASGELVVTNGEDEVSIAQGIQWLI